MPISRCDNIPWVIEDVISHDYKTILDVGVGFGMWGTLFRAFTDIRLSEIDSTRYERWQTQIDGIEIFDRYGNSNWNNYNKIYHGDAIKIMSEIIAEGKKYDLVYLGDIIEHFSKEEGKKLLDLAIQLGKKVIITTPREFRKQEGVLSNEKERHLSFWDDSDFPNSTIKLTEFQRVVFYGSS
jgi:hypothetical protein